MSTTSPTWPIWQRVLFRYAFVFFGFILLAMLGDILSLNKLLWNPLIKFSAETIFQVGEVSDTPTGSGDKLYDWVWYGTVLLLTLILGTLFNVFDFKRAQYNRLQAWLHFLLSVYLSFMLLTYGIIKLYGSQFPPPGLMRLQETYGHSSPMRLLWTFMGASKAYVIFAGACETIPGVLLLFRRTRTLGALLSFAVMTNVFALNVFYDVPVKLLSFQLVVISLLLVLPDLARLIRFFILNRSVAPAINYPITDNKKWYWGIKGLQFLLIIAFVFSISSSTKEGNKIYGGDREKPALYGIYDATTFVLNGDTIPASSNNGSRWQQLVIDYPDYVGVTFADGNRKSLTSATDTTRQVLTLKEQDFSYVARGDTLALDGMYGTDTLRITLQRYDLKRFGLLNRGFHWVNEVPYNRYDRK